MQRRTTANMGEIKKYALDTNISSPAMQDFFSPEEVLHGRAKYWYLMYIFDFAHICCFSSPHCSVLALKIIHVLSLKASSNPMSDIGIVSFSFLIFSYHSFSSFNSLYLFRNRTIDNLIKHCL